MRTWTRRFQGEGPSGLRDRSSRPHRSFVAGIGIFTTIFLTPMFLARVRGFSALEIGLAVFSTGVFQILGIPVYTFLTRRIDLRWLMMSGLAGFAEHVELRADHA